MSDTQPPILNPHTAMAYLPPDLAYQMQIVGHVYVATLAAFIWDWLVSISAEHRMYRKSGLSLPTFAYTLSRIGTLGYLIAVTMFEIVPIADCQALEYAIGIFFEIAVPATSFLFFLRVRAVYNKSKTVTAVFGFLWIAIKGVSLVMLIGMKGAHIGDTLQCGQTKVPKYSMIPIVVVSVTDTLVFLAISYRLASNAIVGDTWRQRARSFFTGDGLYGVSKSLLQSGQFYYFLTIGMGITTTAVMLTSSMPDILRAFLTPPYVALSSALACRVFRSLLVGTLESRNDLEALNTQKIADIMQGVKTIEYQPEFQRKLSFHSEKSHETVTDSDESVDSRDRADSDGTLRGDSDDSFVFGKDSHPLGSLDAV
ncbi:hypothetical protein FIBSPDRAFT_1054442 [Athelia psychrophila]|uniref:DUF6533 domain-containing protein n=1 Tax=Athelia psychrophila TaxID=1759441 RepID=A0A167VAP2_9AGAM|nr:hypothetical protein FIBSPDRAFT_1054442 [Fibularhizoctonia sp. CBS 109695]